MTRPNFESWTSLGGLVALLSLLSAGIFVTAEIDATVSAIENEIGRHETQITDQSIRIRTVENTAGRTDVALELILQSLTEIKGRLARIERQGGN